MTRRILIGYLTKGQGGIDRYIKQVVEYLEGEDVQIDFLTSTKQDDDFKQFLNEHNCRVFLIPSLKDYTGRIEKLKQIMTNNKYDVLYLNISTLAMWRDLKVAKECGVKERIVHSHSTGIDESSWIKHKLISIMHNIGRKEVVKYATKFLCISKQSANWFYPDGLDYEIVYNSIDFHSLEFSEELRKQTRQELNILDEYLVVGFVGLFNYSKNVSFLVDIFKELKKRHEKTALLLVGDGPDRKELEEKVKNEEISDVVFYGYAKNNLQSLYSAMDVFVLPSRFEGFGVVCLEAQANGLKCLFSDVISDEVVITENAVKFLSVDKSPESWAEDLAGFSSSDTRRGSNIVEEKRKLFQKETQMLIVKRLLT